jgi:hypothetical protein
MKPVPKPVPAEISVTVQPLTVVVDAASSNSHKKTRSEVATATSTTTLDKTKPHTNSKSPNAAVQTETPNIYLVSQQVAGPPTLKITLPRNYSLQKSVKIIISLCFMNSFSYIIQTAINKS